MCKCKGRNKYRFLILVDIMKIHPIKLERVTDFCNNVVNKDQEK